MEVDSAVVPDQGDVDADYDENASFDPDSDRARDFRRRVLKLFRTKELDEIQVDELVATMQPG